MECKKGMKYKAAASSFKSMLHGIHTQVFNYMYKHLCSIQKVQSIEWLNRILS